MPRSTHGAGDAGKPWRAKRPTASLRRKTGLRRRAQRKASSAPQHRAARPAVATARARQAAAMDEDRRADAADRSRSTRSIRAPATTSATSCRYASAGKRNLKPGPGRSPVCRHRLRRREQALLPAGRPQRLPDPRARRPRPVGVRSALPPADGVRRGLRDRREVRGRARSNDPLAARRPSRPAMSRRPSDAARKADDIWVLKLFPHAMVQANAFYSREAHGHPVRLFPRRGQSTRATTFRASASSRACRTTSSRTRSRTRSSTGSGPTSPSPRTPTCWRSTRPSPI